MNLRNSGRGGEGRCIDRRAFTMVEMLAVLAIVALMLFIGMPVFQSFSARGMTAATSGLATTLRLARQYAVTKRTEVWVVFPDGRGVYNVRPEIRKAAVSYAVIASNRTTGKLEYISEWKYLPKGLTFITNSTFSVETVFSSYSQGTDRTTEFPFPSDSTNFSQNLSAVLFKSNGQSYRYSRTSSRWTLGAVPNRTVIPITSARYIEVNTNTGLVVRYNDVAGVTNRVFLMNQTGQFRIVE